MEKVKKYWIALIVVYAIAVYLLGMWEGFATAAGYFIIPFAIGALVVWRSRTSTGVIAGHITNGILTLILLATRINDTHEAFKAGVESSCEKNNAAVAATISSQEQKSKYCTCIVEKLGDDMFIGSIKARFLDFQDADGVMAALQRDNAYQTKASSAQVYCSAKALDD